MSLSRRSQASVDITPKLEKEIRARTHIRPNDPNTKPGDPGNGQILIVDEKHQKFNGQVYYRNKNGYYVANVYTSSGKRTLAFLHIAVWMFHNGAKPEGYVIHHEHKDADGNWDTTCNDIECLLLMTTTEHKSWHAKFNKPIELECEVCHQIFLARSKTARYCPDCFKEVCRAVNHAHTNKSRQPFKAFEENSQSLSAVANTEDDIPRTNKEGKKMIRHCFFCHRPFETVIADEQVACSRPDCDGKKFIHAYEQAKAYAFRDKLKNNGGFLKRLYKQFNKNIRCLFIKGEVWFVAKDVCDVLEYKNSRDALSKHVDPEDKGVAKRDTLGGPQNFAIINESGMYSLIFGSKLPSAKQFKRWVASVLLPSLRKSGQFIITEETAPPVPFPEDTTFVLVDANDQPFSFSNDEREFMQKLIPAYRQMNENDRALLVELIERNQD